ncbi:MAG: hypothetical protein BZY79_02485 [SAR202 cluster bacterium Casp-Chloro-G4]|nr:hypothetical protein [Chloroflexota bacterium]MDA1227997.1 hypothetical protein [Chloroflexota bacterium]PKB61698.1 MAG: hypothetical protein BZY79_02485 [SAR202 cluster bacterium Casp-Chloro-G4]
MLAILVAFEREIKDYLRAGQFRLVEKEDAFRFYLSPVCRDVVVVEGGFGPQMSRDAVRLVADKYPPDLLVSAGYAAGSRPDMVTGEVVVCSRLQSLTGEAAYWNVDTILGKSVPESVLPYDQWNDIEVRWGSCLTMPYLVSGSSMKEWLGRTFATDVIDMESYWVSEAAEELGIPHIILRAVFDPMGQTLPSFVAKSLDGSAVQTALRAASYMASHPTSIKRTIALLTQSRQATASLSRFLLNLTPDGAQALNLALGAR